MTRDIKDNRDITKSLGALMVESTLWKIKSDVEDNLKKLPEKAEKKDRDRKYGAIVDMMVGLVERVGQLVPRQKLKPHCVGPKAPSS